MLGRIRVVTLLLVLGLLCLPGTYPSIASSPSAALALPQDRLHFGLANGPGDISWMTSSGVPWRYRYQYLAGGVNTGTGWETWNTPAGAFASFYLSDSGANNYIPVFTYYELLQSTPSTGASESDRDYSNLNNAATMNAYYANFKLLMQKVGAYAKPTVIHIEPDFWGYMTQRAAGGDASAVAAKVAGSGFADVAGIPDTVQGFGYALLKLRDLYAPNATMALHASMWGSGFDVATNTSPTLNAATEADKTAAFLNSAGITSNPFGSTWDLVFNDVDDHDAAWWEAQGNPDHWWDTTNTKFPNFSRYLSWVAELKLKTVRPQVVWQVPNGNQFFLTMNNKCGHYQDNVAPYFISHATDLFSAGLIAVMFGAGNGCQTSYSDSMGDGVTNNLGVPTSDAAGNCNACNTHTSIWADDDGGYIRIFVGLYYNNAISLGGLVTGDPHAASWAAGRLDVFIRGADKALWHKAWNGTAWLAWEPLGGILESSPGAVSGTANRVDIFVRGTDGALWHKLWNGTAWQAWESLGGIVYGPAATSTGATQMDVFVRGSDKALWHRTWNGTTWLPWESLDGLLTSDPGSVSWGANRLDAFGRGTDNAIWHRAWNGTSWGAWESLGGTLLSGPAASSCASGSLDVFAVGTDYGLWRRSFNGTTWTAWKSIGGQWTSGPGAVCQPGTTIIDVFEKGPDNALWRLELPN